MAIHSRQHWRLGRSERRVLPRCPWQSPNGSGALSFVGKPWENHGKTMGKWWFSGILWDLPPGDLNIAMENHHV